MSVSSSFQRLISWIEPSETELASAMQHANTIRRGTQRLFIVQQLFWAQGSATSDGNSCSSARGPHAGC
jgi:hypothetical protein